MSINLKTTSLLKRSLIVAVSGLAMLAAVGPGSIMAADRANTLIVGSSGALNTLDPLRVDYNQTSVIVSGLYDALVTYDGNKLVGELATEFVAAADAKSISITLRDDVKFHDGTPLTAKDVAYSLDRVTRLGLGIASLVGEYESTTVIDDTHLIINLNQPSSLFLASLSKIYIVNAALVEANAGADDGQAWLQAHDAGSGAFILGPQGQDVSLSRFEDYWAPAEGRPESVIFRRIDESATKRDELRAGNIDVAYSLGDRDAAGFLNDPDFAVVPIKTSYQTEILFNTAVGPTADLRVRQALRMVYDYEGGLRSIRGNNGELANGVVPPGLDCRPDLPVVKRDLDAAKALLAEAGVADMKLVMNFQPVFEAQKQEATLFQSNLREIGVELELEPIAFPNWMANLNDVNTIPQMMLLEDFAQVPDAGIMLSKAYRSDAIGTNRTGYSNPDVDALIDEALSTGDEAKRCDIYKQIQVILNDDAVMIDMYGVNKPAVYRVGTLENLVSNLLVTPSDPTDFRFATKR